MRGMTAIVVAGAALVFWCAAASAAVSIAPDRIVVTGDGANATITRAPFRLSFADGAGRTVLAEVPNEAPAPFPVTPDLSPPPLGQDTPRGPALYAPLGFTVGERPLIQNPAGQWEGNVVTGTAAGVTYGARDVVDAAPEGDGVRMTVATNDPSGRRLLVTVAPGPQHTIRVTVRPSSADGVAAMADSFGASAGEAFRGFGGRHNALDQRGEDFLGFVQQQNVGAGQLAPAVEAGNANGDRYLFPSGRSAAYYVQSQFVSSAGFGFLLARDELSRWRMASDRPDAWQVEAAAPALDYLVAPGDGPRAIADLTAVTGRHRVPPAWAAGTILDRLTRYPSESPSSYAALVDADLRDIARHHLPLDAYRIEGWEFYTRDELRKVIARLKAMGIRPMLYFRAFVGTDANVGTDNPARFQEALDKGYVARTATGQPYVFVSNFNVPSALIDFTNPDAVAWWKGRIREALDLGADGFMQDFGEQVRIDMRFADGSDGLQMHNRYPVLFHRATREAADAWHREHPDRPEPFFFTRAGYSGEPGSAAYENANFAGDGTTDWSRSSGLASQTPDMLNRAIGGAYGFTTDIGGYFDIGPYSPTTKELFLRWAQFAALSPLFRLHGSVGAGTHTPWSYDDDTVAQYNALSRLHLRARPLILALWREAVRTGMPVTRPLWLAAPGDAEAARQDQEWMLGDDVLVAPVVTEAATSRAVYFPRGCWEGPETGARFTGPGAAKVDAPLDRLPYFFRCGTAPFAAADGSAARLPRRCTSRRRFTIRLREPRGRERLVAARVYVNGRAVRVVRGRRLRARIDLRGLPRRRVRVRIVARTDRGRTLRTSRTYRTCTRRAGL